ncbi:TPA: HD domain-containing protein [Enterococcus faecalis]|uniref:HD domain-containing protein n=1 Tax=Enterococcus durans TaxID=53345 RepID=UPI00193B61DF|nr:HD domain-containing protein [Enterococcus durans]MBM1151963.1 bifunctional (p)ppGpp synthetase/guanosine-3',5'-bis(diphosphate) 3'-pyrophosphohydrolase [Enterococcus durans]
MILLAKADTIASKALKLALDAHEGQVDKAGVDYANHFVTVGEFVKEVTDNEQILAVAYLHDILEDTDVTEKDLEKLFSDEIIGAVKALTKEKYEYYQYYLERVKANEWARIVKLADLKHNSDMDRIKKKLKTPLGLRDFKRMKKYQDAIKFLEAE